MKCFLEHYVKINWNATLPSDICRDVAFSDMPFMAFREIFGSCGRVPIVNQVLMKNFPTLPVDEGEGGGAREDGPFYLPNYRTDS